MKKSKIMGLIALAAIIIAAICIFSSKEVKANADDLTTFKEKIAEDYYIQEGEYVDFDVLGLASQGQLPSCFGNNEGSYYQVAFLPPAPEQNAAKGIARLNWADEYPTEIDDPEVDNYPANPYFVPGNWSYKLREDEAIVLMYELPPECKYFSIGAYLFLTEIIDGYDYSHDPTFTQIPATEDTGNYRLAFSSLGDMLNNFTIKSSGSDEPYGAKAVVIIGGDKKTNAALTEQLKASGIDEGMINVIEIPSAVLNLGLEKGADTFALLGRVSQPTDKARYEEYIASMPQTAEILRITPKVQGESEEIAWPAMRPRGTGVHEASLLSGSLDDLETIRENIIAKYAGQGYTYEELIPEQAVPEGVEAIYNGINSKGDCRDTTYTMTPRFTLDSDEDFVVFYGVNHTQTGKAIYSNAVLLGAKMMNGVASIYDSQFIGSAAEYLPESETGSDFYYVYKFDREGTDPYSQKVEYSTGNERGKYYGVDNGEPLRGVFRAYIEKETLVGPAYSEIIYDRAIVFHKNTESAQ